MVHYIVHSADTKEGLACDSGALRLSRLESRQRGVSRPYSKFSANVEIPMLILAVVMIPVLIIPLVVHHLSSGTTSLLTAADFFIWAVFMLEYLIKLTLAPNRKEHFKKSLLDLVVVAVPFLRPLRIVRSIRALRALRLVRLSAFAGEGANNAKRSLHSRSGDGEDEQMIDVAMTGRAGRWVSRQ